MGFVESVVSVLAPGGTPSLFVEVFGFEVWDEMAGLPGTLCVVRTHPTGAVLRGVGKAGEGRPPCVSCVIAEAVTGEIVLTRMFSTIAAYSPNAFDVPLMAPIGP
jgi:hypothetical protein